MPDTQTPLPGLGHAVASQIGWQIPVNTMDVAGPPGPAWMRLVHSQLRSQSPRNGCGGWAGWLRTAVQVCVSICGHWPRGLERVRLAVELSGGGRVSRIGLDPAITSSAGYRYRLFACQS